MQCRMPALCSRLGIGADFQGPPAARRARLLRPGPLQVTRWLPEHPGGSRIIPAQSLNLDCRCSGLQGAFYFAACCGCPAWTGTSMCAGQRRVCHASSALLACTPAVQPPIRAVPRLTRELCVPASILHGGCSAVSLSIAQTTLMWLLSIHSTLLETTSLNRSLALERSAGRCWCSDVGACVPV